MQIIFEISVANAQRITDAMKGLFPIPVDAEGMPLFTDGQWAKEAIRLFARNSVARYEQKIAREAIGFAPDDDLIT